jgi:hypothetical protein
MSLSGMAFPFPLVADYTQTIKNPSHNMKEGLKSGPLFGNPAILIQGPVALRLRVTPDLPFSKEVK